MQVSTGDVTSPPAPAARRARAACGLALAAAACAPASFDWNERTPPALAEYRGRFVAAVGDELTATLSREEALDRCERAGILWLGDHHRHSRLHGLQSQLLRELQQRGARMALGLEAVGVRDQRAVDAFLAGELDMRALRERMRVRWAGSWLDDRELDPWFFRGLLEFAREHDLPVFALEPTPRLPLDQRDRYMAHSITTARARHPDRLLVVVAGQTHLLGGGDLVGRVGAGGLVVGGAPTAPLRASFQRGDAAAGRGDLLRSDAGVLWFAEMFGDEAVSARRRPPAPR